MWLEEISPSRKKWNSDSGKNSFRTVNKKEIFGECELVEMYS